ncbi:hypothetical protein DRO55_05715 [Candidatus Bathyarchaeota archaeon]|nr:MAG: hypothetical protein DRO55_05715 [Candidatus Bathyarchaeota archaeon]
MLKVSELRPGMSNVDLEVRVVEVHEPKEIVMSGGVRRRIMELRVEDGTGEMMLVLWDDKVIEDLDVGDTLRIKNGFVTSYRGVWRINVGRYGELERLNEE